MDDLMKPFVRDGTSNASQFVHTHQRDIGRMVAFLPQDPGVKERGLNVLTTCFSQASFARAASSSSRFLSLESSSSIQLVSVWQLMLYFSSSSQAASHDLSRSTTCMQQLPHRFDILLTSSSRRSTSGFFVTLGRVFSTAGRTCFTSSTNWSIRHCKNEHQQVYGCSKLESNICKEVFRQREK